MSFQRPAKINFLELRQIIDYLEVSDFTARKHMWKKKTFTSNRICCISLKHSRK